MKSSAVRGERSTCNFFVADFCPDEGTKVELIIVKRGFHRTRRNYF
jgi:hypothetical protein